MLRFWFSRWFGGCCRGRSRFWFGLSLLVAAVYGLQALSFGFSSAHVVQDDARQHVFWMQRWLDPQLFPGDLIADYLQSVAPPGYKAVYAVLVQAGWSPLVVSKLLPLVLGLITTVYAFRLCLELLPVPGAAFLATLLLNQSLWLRNDLVSATPRAFLYPLFLAFLFYLVRRAWLPCLVAIALQGGFYPHFVLVAIAIVLVRLVQWRGGRLRLSRCRQDYVWVLLALAIAAVVLLPYKFGPDPYGPIITVAQARLAPEFGPQGRSFFFNPNPLVYWLTGERSGLLFLPLPPLVLTGLALPLVLAWPQRFPLARKVSPQIGLLGQILLASLGLFLLAHLLLFQLHLPSRYMHHSLVVVLALAAGLTLAIALQPLMSWPRSVGQWGWRCGVGLLLLGLLLWPFNPQTTRFYQDWVVGKRPQLYAYLQQQPKDTLIASISLEASHLPTFAQRSILVGREYALPYHQGYYQPFRQRMLELLQAHYSPELLPLQTLIQTYGVDLVLVDRDALTLQYLGKNPWLRQYQPAFDQAIARLQAGEMPALAKAIEACAVPEIDDGPAILRASCILAGAD